MKFNNYPPDEIKRIEEISEFNEKMEEFLTKERSILSTQANSFITNIKREYLTREKIEIIFNSQAEALSMREEVNDKISTYLTKLSRNNAKIKVIRQEKQVFYLTGFQLKVGATEKKDLIEAHLAQNERYSQLLEVHIDHLRNLNKILESFAFAVKNSVDLLNFLN